MDIGGRGVIWTSGGVGALEGCELKLNLTPYCLNISHDTSV